MDRKPPAEKDVAVKAWLKAKGLKVDETDSDGRQGVYFWIHFPKRGRPLILGISQEVMADTPLFAIQELLDRLHVVAELRAQPGTARVLVRRNDAFVLEDFARV